MIKQAFLDIEIPENIKQLTPNNLWLLEHQITAFWHGFGFSNSKGFIVPKSMTEEYTFPREKIAKRSVNPDYLNLTVDVTHIDAKQFEVITN